MEVDKTKVKNKNQEKGAKTEEYLAEYFRMNGYFVVRGVEVVYNNNKVTDIDLWLYLKSSNMSQEITIVDIKNRKSPQAFERFLWVKGLQVAVNADKAIIATTESNPEILRYGDSINVKVLDGNFLKKVPNSVDLKDRISEEELESMIKNTTFGKLDGDWKGRLDLCKSLFANGITFDTLNVWIENASYFAIQVISRPQSKEVALRVFYKLLSYICIGIDSLSKELIYEDKPTRYNQFLRGFQFGDKDYKQMRNDISMAISVVKRFSNNTDLVESNIIQNFLKAIESLNCRVLAEYFSNLNNIAELIEIAFEFDKLAMGSTTPTTYESSTKSKKIIGCFLDFWEISRSDYELVKKTSSQ